MKIENVTLKGFRCFGPEGTTVPFEDGITTLVGNNGAGAYSGQPDHPFRFYSIT